MKKSRIAKLSLMGASIAALAATLTTSTYAWYVSNKTATVTGGTGSTGSAGADGSVLLSWANGENAVWGKELKFTDSNAPTISTASLQPVHYDTTTSAFYGLDDDTPTTKPTAAASSNKYIQFTLYATTESSTAITVTPSIVINNTTGSSTGLAQLAYVGTDKGSPVAQGSSFYYDALDALYVQQKIGTALKYVAASDNGVRGTSTGISAGAQDSGDGDAHAYYKNVAGTPSITLWNEAPISSSEGGLGTISLIKGTETAITYTIYLDGGDEDCFNSCANQTISFALTYTVQ